LQIELSPVEETQKSVLRQLVELYEYDFSEFNQNDINEYGYFGYKYLDTYWTEEGRAPFFIKVSGILAGFVLVNEYCYLVKEAGAKSIAEFFVMRKYRRQGIGKAAAFIIFDRYPGHWEVIQQEDNVPSIRFWERVVNEYTRGRFQKKPVQTEDWLGQALIFDNSS
jgi:predicted acetyltransferase